MSARGWLLVLLAASLAGCATYHARPLDPSGSEAAFRSRSLSDPGLRAFAEAHRSGGSWPPETWNLEDLALVAFYYQPDLEVARARVSVAEAGIRTAGARPNPRIGVAPTFNTSALSGVSPWILALNFDIPIETAGKRGDRIARAERLTDAARLARAETAWRVRSRVRAAVLEHLLATRELGLRHAEEGVRAESVRVMELRLAVGDVSRPDVDGARIDLANTRLAVKAAEGAAGRTRVGLAGALGLPVSGLDGASFSWPGLDRPPSEADVSPARVQRAGLLNRLDVRRSLAEYEAEEAGLRLEIAKQYPDIHLGPGYTFDQGDNKFTLGLSITLPAFDQNQGPIAAAEARRREAAARFAALQARVIREVEDARVRYHSALAELADADAALAVVRAREAAVRRELEAGEADRLALVGAQLQRVVAEQAGLAAVRKTQEALGALEDAVERPLGAESNGETR